MGKKNILALAAMMAAAAGETNKIFGVPRKEEYITAMRCADCQHCPGGNGTFCKVAGHHVSKYTNCRCNYFVGK